MTEYELVIRDAFTDEEKKITSRVLLRIAEALHNTSDNQTVLYTIANDLVPFPCKIGSLVVCRKNLPGGPPKGAIGVVRMINHIGRKALVEWAYYRDYVDDNKVLTATYKQLLHNKHAGAMVSFDDIVLTT